MTCTNVCYLPIFCLYPSFSNVRFKNCPSPQQKVLYSTLSHNIKRRQKGGMLWNWRALQLKVIWGGQWKVEGMSENSNSKRPLELEWEWTELLKQRLPLKCRSTPHLHEISGNTFKPCFQMVNVRALPQQQGEIMFTFWRFPHHNWHLITLTDFVKM